MFLAISKSKIPVYCYGVAIFAYALQQTAFITRFPMANRFFYAVILFAIAVSLLIEITRHSTLLIKTFALLIMFILVVVGNIFFNEGPIDFIYILFFIYVCRENEPVKIFQAYYIAVLSAVFITVIAMYVRILPNSIIRNNDCLGFLYLSFGPNMFLHGCIAYVAGTKNRITNWKWLVIMAVNFWFFIKTDTLSAFVFVLVLFVLCKFFSLSKIRKRLEDKKSVLNTIIVYQSYLAAVFIIIIQLLYNKFYYSIFWQGANAFFSQRLMLGRKAFLDYPIKLFGQPILWNTGLATSIANEYFYVDSSFLQILLRYGIVMLLGVCSLMTIVANYSKNEKTYFVTIALSVFTLHCIFDPQLLSFRYNPFIICVIYAFNRRKIKYE